MFRNSEYVGWVYASYFVCAIIFSLLINRLFLKFVRTLGIRNNNDGTVIRWGSLSKPAVGGFSFYILFLLSITSYSVLFDSNQIFLSKEFVGLLVATMLGFLMGLADDAYNTRPLLKFTAQLTCGVILMVSGISINVSPFMPVNYVLTIFWVIGIMNSLNMLDNMDAITTSVAIMIILSALTLIYIHLEYHTIYFFILLGVMGALIGFLYYNWHPSKMYMGDTGSQFLGIFLAAIGIKFFWNQSTPPINDFMNARHLIIPMLIFIMPIIDTTIVVINRLTKKKSPFIGGKDHTTHCLVYLGFTERQVALVIIGVCALSLALVAMIESYIVEWNHYYTLIFITYFLILFSVFMYITKMKTRSMR